MLAPCDDHGLVPLITSYMPQVQSWTCLLSHTAIYCRRLGSGIAKKDDQAGQASYLSKKDNSTARSTSPASHRLVR